MFLEASKGNCVFFSFLRICLYEGRRRLWKKKEFGMDSPRLRLGAHLEILCICVSLPMGHRQQEYTSKSLGSKGEISTLNTKFLGTRNVTGKSFFHNLKFKLYLFSVTSILNKPLNEPLLPQINIKEDAEGQPQVHV